MARFGPRQRRRLHAVRLVRAPAATGLSTIERPWREEGLRVPQRKRRRHRLGESTVSAERQRACNRVLADRGRVSPLCGRRRICRGVRSQVVAITGGSAGVGRATALAFARRGHPVGLLARGEERLESTRPELDALRRSVPRPCRPTSRTPSRSRRRPSGSRRHSARSTSGSTTRWRPSSRRSSGLTPEEFRRATEVTYLGSVWGTMAALRRMRPRDRGVIVQVGSALAYRGIPLQAAYCGAKHALQGFLESLRTELLHDGLARAADDGAAAGAEHAAVHLEPGEDAAASRSRCRRSSSPRWPPRRSSGRRGTRRREVMVGWPTVKAIVGNAVAPGVADRYLARDGYRGAADRRARSTDDRPGNLFEPVARRPGRRTARSTSCAPPVLAAVPGAPASPPARRSRRVDRDCRCCGQRRLGRSDMSQLVADYILARLHEWGVAARLRLSGRRHQRASLGAFDRADGRSGADPGAPRGDGRLHGLRARQVHRRGRRLPRDLGPGRDPPAERPLRREARPPAGRRDRRPAGAGGARRRLPAGGRPA